MTACCYIIVEISSHKLAVYTDHFLTESKGKQCVVLFQHFFLTQSGDSSTSDTRELIFIL